MHYSIYKLKFLTPIHIGDSRSALNLESGIENFRADTLFSALCIEALKQEGQKGIQELIDLAQEEKLILSDSMPWFKNRYFLPKPYFKGVCQNQVSKDDLKERKKLKNLNWILIDEYKQFIKSLKNGKHFLPETEDFGKFYQQDRVSIPRNTNEESNPYYVGLYEFNNNAGLYFILGYDDQKVKERITSLLKSLSYTGIGGKTSSGAGKFEVNDIIDLEQEKNEPYQSLLNLIKSETDLNILLTTSIPVDKQLDEALKDAYFMLVRRGGFIQSNTYAPSIQKKQTQFFLDSGSVLKKRFNGDLKIVASKETGNHNVYRYNLPMFIGIDL